MKKNMPKEEVINLVERVFNVILNSTDLNDIIDLLIKEKKLAANKINELKFPRISFHLTHNDIFELKSKNYINEDYKFILNPKDLENESTLTKLLYSIVWKNGDLGKEGHILKGIDGVKKDDDKALVFYQFGKYIGDIHKKEPIIDQHTLRAYGIYLCLTNQISRIGNGGKQIMDIDYYRKLSLTKKSEIPLIEDYKKFIQSHFLYTENDFVYSLDMILFALGKAIKLSK
jgi:hypothetical protein